MGSDDKSELTPWNRSDDCRSTSETRAKQRNGGIVRSKIILDTIVAKIDKQSQPDVINPRSEQEISVEVLGKISGYLKGYGIQLNTRATKFQAMLNSEINMENMMFIAMNCGVDPATIPRFISNGEDEVDMFI
ncbi:hypothetical protein Dimus_039322 [Dionaea muscipula]